MKILEVTNKLNLLNVLLIISFILIAFVFIFTPKEYVIEILFVIFIIVYIFFKYSLVRTTKYMKSLEHNLESFDKYVIFSKSDLNGKIIDANKAFTDISGYSRKELIGKPHNIVRHPDMKAKVFEQMWDELRERKYWRGEVKNKKKNGGFYWVDTIIEADYDSNGNHIGFHAIRIDITSKKELEALKKDLERFNEHLESQNDEKIVEVIALNKEIKDTQKEIIFTMAAIGETRSQETGNHVKRVAEYTKLLAIYSGMHEIGKVGIQDSILNKPGKLTPDEMEIMKTHARLGFDMLKHSDKKILGIAATIAHEHHERYDGTGYPNALKGKNISLEGRITAIADVFDALGSQRAYKKAWRDEDIFNMFIQEKGKHFDPELVDIFLENKEEFFKIRDKFVD